MGNISPAVVQTPSAVARHLASRVRAERKARGWSRLELAERSGVNVETLKRFETTGRISLDRLLRIASALGGLAGFAALFPEPVAESLDELIERDHHRGHSGGHKRLHRGQRLSSADS